MITTTEKIKACQRAVGSAPDGRPGDSTYDAFYRFLEAMGVVTIDYPFYSYQWGTHVIWMKPEQLKLISGEGTKLSVSKFNYAMSGSFTSPSGVKPCSFLVNDGEVIWGRACHANTRDGELPETVLYWLDNGYQDMKLCRIESDLPEGVKTAIGGMRLLENGLMVKRSFNEDKEGFKGRFSDVFRTTQHCGIGVDKYGNVGLALSKWSSMAAFQQKAQNIGFIDFIAIDGGSVSAMNCPDQKYRAYQKQGYIIAGEDKL